MADDRPMQEGVAALSRFLVGETTVAETLQAIVDLTTTAVPPATYAGLTLLVEDKVTTAVYSDETVVEIDRAQYATAHGPCLDAFRDGVVCAIPSTEGDTTWPAFSRTALDAGIRSTLSLPLAAAKVSLGALNLYAEAEDAFSDDDQRAGEAFATQAAVVLANVQAYWDARTLGEQLHEAMASRATIEQAKGIIMAQSKVGPDAAFDLLRKASQRENRKLRDVAQALVDRYCGGDGA